MKHLNSLMVRIRCLTKGKTSKRSLIASKLDVKILLLNVHSYFTLDYWIQKYTYICAKSENVNAKI